MKYPSAAARLWLINMNLLAKLTLEIRGSFKEDVIIVIHFLGTLISMWSSSALCHLPFFSAPALPSFAPISVYPSPQTISLFFPL